MQKDSVKLPTHFILISFIFDKIESVDFKHSYSFFKLRPTNTQIKDFWSQH